MHSFIVSHLRKAKNGEDVYHYHLHVVYIPVVEKQILWSKRCKDEALRGTVKETITQVSRSKKWDSKPLLDENGNPMLNANGKKILKSSYSVLQDDFFHFMRNAGYLDALKYLPQAEIRARFPDAEGFYVSLTEEGAPEDYEDTLTYRASGAGEISGWQIHLALTPRQEHLQMGEEAASVQEAKTLHLFYENGN